MQFIGDFCFCTQTFLERNRTYSEQAVHRKLREPHPPPPFPGPIILVLWAVNRMEWASHIENSQNEFQCQSVIFIIIIDLFSRLVKNYLIAVYQSLRFSTALSPSVKESGGRWTLELHAPCI